MEARGSAIVDPMQRIGELQSSLLPRRCRHEFSVDLNRP
jgi:hypothetical protein